MRNTRILEISVTLPDAKKAQALAKFLAEATVELNRSGLGKRSGSVAGYRAAGARTRARDWRRSRRLGAAAVRRAGGRVCRSRLEKAADIAVQDGRAEAEHGTGDRRRGEREKTAGRPRSRSSQGNATRARAWRRCASRCRSWTGAGAEREKLLATAPGASRPVGRRAQGGQAALAAMEARLREARGETGFRGERLKIIDPGIVPERPSSPNLPLNVAAALLLGLVLPICS